MIRWATISAKQVDAVQLQVHKSPACDGCQLHCDKPLFDLFKLHKDHFWLSKNSQKIQLSNPEVIFSDARQVGEKVGMELSENSLLKTAFMVYILPLILSMISMVLGQLIFDYMMLNADLGALIGFLFGFLLFYSLMQTKWRSKAMPKVTFL